MVLIKPQVSAAGPLIATRVSGPSGAIAATGNGWMGSSASLMGPSYSRPGGRPPGLCYRTVRASFESHGS